MGQVGFEPACNRRVSAAEDSTWDSTRSPNRTDGTLRPECAERDRPVDLAVFGERVDVVVGRDALAVAEQLGKLGERAGALVVERPAAVAQAVWGRSARC